MFELPPDHTSLFFPADSGTLRLHITAKWLSRISAQVTRVTASPFPGLITSARATALGLSQVERFFGCLILLSISLKI